MKLTKFILTLAVCMALAQAVNGQVPLKGQLMQVGKRTFPISQSIEASQLSIVPAPGDVTSLKSFEITINGASEVTRGNVDYGNAPYVLAEGSDDKKYCFSMNFEGNTMTLAVSNEITEIGNYTLHLPAGFYNVDGETADEEYTFNYTITDDIPVTYDYTVNPEPGNVTSLKSFEITINGASEVTRGNVDYGNAPYVLAEGSDDKKYCFSMNFEGNTMTLAVSNEITEIGNYTLHLPAGFYNIDGVAAVDSHIFNYQVVESIEAGIINEQPAGTRVDCQTEFLSWYVTAGFLGGMNLDGKPTHYVIGDDDCLYLWNPILTTPYGPTQTQSYIKGVKEGDHYVFYFPQPVATKMVNGEEEILYVNFMENVTTEDDSSTYVVVENNNNYSFKILENGDCVPVNESDELYIVGYTNAEGKWEGFGNVDMKYIKFNYTPHAIPENSTIQDWIMEYSKGGSDQRLQTGVQVVIKDNDIWVKGFSQIYCPNDWAHGTIDADNVIHFDPYLGLAEKVGQYAFVYNGYVNSTSNLIYPCVMVYDPENKTITDEQDLLINPNQRWYYTLENYVLPVLSDNTIELTSRVPLAPEKINNFFVLDQDTGRTSVSINLSSENVDSQPLNPANLYFQILIPGFRNFEVYTFEPENYSELTEAITDIPYNMISGLVSGYGVQRNTYIFVPDCDNIGARMVYKDETGIYYSEPTFYYPVDGSGTNDIKDEKAVESLWFTLQGIRIDEPQQSGLYIRRDTYASGSVRSCKIQVIK